MPKINLVASASPTPTEGSQERQIITKLTLYVTKHLYLMGKATAMNLSTAIGMRTNINEFLKKCTVGELEGSDIK